MRSLVSAIAAMSVLVMATAASAQSKEVERQFKGAPDTNINVGIFTSIHRNCTAAPLPVIRLIVPPAHGKVTVKQGRLRATNFKRCLGADLPAFVALYRSRRDFIGQDMFTLEIIGAGGKSQFERITVTVGKPGTAHGI